MRTRTFLFVYVLLMSCLGSWAKEVTDTLDSNDGDRVIVSYVINQANNKFDVIFRDTWYKLGQTHQDKYRKLENVVVLFFDRIGNYADNTRFSGINIEAFMIPSGVQYTTSEDGFFSHTSISKRPLSIELASVDSVEISIPMYLAYYEKKHRYNVFSRCEDLVIKLSKKKPKKASNEIVTQQVSQTVTVQEEVEEGLPEEAEVDILIRKISDYLQKQDEYPFPDELRKDISDLRDKKYRINDDEIVSRIQEMLDVCELKEQKLKKAKEDAENRADSLKKVEQESIATIAQQQADKEKRRNLWLIIGGVILAILGFIGNQVIQHLRNAKNQKNIMAMQKKAEEELKRQAANAAQNQVNQQQSNVQQLSRNINNAGMGKNKPQGGKKRISI